MLLEEYTPWKGRRARSWNKNPCWAVNYGVTHHAALRPGPMGQYWDEQRHLGKNTSERFCSQMSCLRWKRLDVTVNSSGRAACGLQLCCVHQPKLQFIFFACFRQEQRMVCSQVSSGMSSSVMDCWQSQGVCLQLDAGEHPCSVTG